MPWRWHGSRETGGGGNWRRVPESNRSSRICNPSDHADIIKEGCKHPPLSRQVNSDTYGQAVNETASVSDWTPVAEAAASWLDLHPEDLKLRAELADNLAEAIGDCHPDDACQIMTAALIDLSAGRNPVDYFVNAHEDAAWWASIAAPAELSAVLSAVLARLKDRALHLRLRKELFMVLWRSFAPDDQRRFLARAKGEV